MTAIGPDGAEASSRADYRLRAAAVIRAAALRGLSTNLSCCCHYAVIRGRESERSSSFAGPLPLPISVLNFFSAHSHQFVIPSAFGVAWRSRFALLALALLSTDVAAAPVYPWTTSIGAPTSTALEDTLAVRFSPPEGFVRQPSPPMSWATWLRGLPLKPHGSAVHLHNGKRKWRQDAHAAVVDIDVGKRDLQQCADAVMRLRAEWLYSQSRVSEIAFNNTNGKRMRFTAWRSKSYAGFRKYMIQVFAYAGTYSLSRELKSKPVADLAIGDVFIRGGFPGHAVLVADMAVNPTTREKKFLLLQSYMPAQDVHVLRNPNDPNGGAWYSGDISETLVTPEWTFASDSLKTWRD
jgi:uncharacterized protein DUF4846